MFHMINNLPNNEVLPLTDDSQYLRKLLQEKDLKIQELGQANAQWQQYSQQQDLYVIKVQQELSTSKLEIENLKQQLSEKNKTLTQLQDSFDRAMQDDRRKSAEQCSKSAEENQQLHQKLLETEAKLEEAIRRLKLESSRPTNTPSDVDSQVMVLREQARAYKEDFESERRDRERACNRAAELQSELDVVQQQLKNYTQKESQSYLQRRQAALEYYRAEYERTHPGASALAQSDGGNAEDGYDEID